MHLHKWTTWTNYNDGKIRDHNNNVLREVVVYRKACQKCGLPKYKQITVGSV